MSNTANDDRIANLTDAAKTLGMSARTLYRRMERQHRKFAEFCDADGVLTDDGLEAIRQIACQKGNDKPSDASDETAKNSLAKFDELQALTASQTVTINSLQARIDTLEREAEHLKQTIAERDREVEHYRHEVERWQEEARQANTTAQQAQQLHLMHMQLLPAPGEKRGLFGRLFGRRSKESDA